MNLSHVTGPRAASRQPPLLETGKAFGGPQIAPTAFAGEVSGSPHEAARAIAAIGAVDAVPTLLEVVCEITGMKFAAVAWVTDTTWTTCAVKDDLHLGMAPGCQLALGMTPCLESWAARGAVVIEHASADPRYRSHAAAKLYGIESYVSVPIILSDGRYFGNLCALDLHPLRAAQPQILSMFTRFAALIASQLGQQSLQQREHRALLDERAAGELREQFIAILGHELRNPLHAVSACGDLLERKLTDPTLLAYVSRVKTNVRRMSSLIEDVLDFARGRLGGGIGLELTEVEDISGGLTTIVQELRDAWPERKILADIRVERAVRCDLARLQQVASNLLANALTHGRPDSEVKIAAAADAEELILEVWNAGTPIPAESLPKIFEPFWRHSTCGTRNGLGLGLHICSQIVHAHGGGISVTSSAERGTKFTARVPLSTLPTREAAFALPPQTMSASHLAFHERAAHGAVQ